MLLSAPRQFLPAPAPVHKSRGIGAQYGLEGLLARLFLRFLLSHETAPVRGPSQPILPAVPATTHGPDRERKLQVPDATHGDIRTDLALETLEEIEVQTGASPPGILHEQYQAHPGVHISDVQVTTSEAVDRLKKPRGRYITIESRGLISRNLTLQAHISEALTGALQQLLPELQDEDPVLVVGLGNANATPDALGPRTTNLTLVTRHLREHVPEDLAGTLRPVAALAPGVLGTTGMETEEVIRGILARVEVSALVVVDALAARTTRRLFGTVQVTDSGIQPGAGIANDRPPINAESAGVPVVAVGVPTVVHAVTIAAEAVSTLAQRKGTPQDSPDEVSRTLRPLLGDMVVTLKEVDLTVREAAQVIARGVNAALQPEWDEDTIAEIMA